MSFLDDLDLAAPIETRNGRTYPYGTVGEWVPIAPVSHLAVRVYTVLRLHVNRSRGDDRAWPAQDDLAAMCGVSRRQTIAAAVTELVELGALDVEAERYARGMRSRAVYTVHEAPPEGYEGPTSLREWYRANKPVPAPSAGPSASAGRTCQK